MRYSRITNTLPVSAMLIILTFLITPVVDAGTLTKYWWHQGGTTRGWSYRYKDRWGGRNYWCVGAGGDCWIYDWKAIYEFDIGTGGCTPPTPEETNNQAYGEYLIQEEASTSGVILPNDLSPVSYTVVCGDGGLQ